MQRFHFLKSWLEREIPCTGNFVVFIRFITCTCLFMCSYFFRASGENVIESMGFFHRSSLSSDRTSVDFTSFIRKVRSFIDTISIETCKLPMFNYEIRSKLALHARKLRRFGCSHSPSNDRKYLYLVIGCAHLFAYNGRRY